MTGQTLTRFIARYLPILLLFLQAASLFAQQNPIKITGLVTSAEDGQTLIGVNILEKGTTNGTVTEVDGTYRLDAAADAILVFSFIGFEEQEIAVAGKPKIDVVLSQGSKLLNEVLVTGYKREIKSDVATAISSIKSKDIEKLVVMGIDQALQGQAAGIMVTQTTGAPGDDIAVRIRGAGTIGNNNPLYVIDGVPTTGNINMFSTNDIESIEVLKDGASAAIYGARAANGVILITTKKGKAGKARFTFDASTGIQEANRLPKLLNSRDYLTIRNEAIANANSLRDSIRRIPLYDPAILDTLADTDWMSKVFSNAPIQRYSLSATGGGESGNFYIQGEYQDQDGVFRGQGFKKYSLRFNGEAGSKRFKIGNNLSFAVTDRKVINSSGDGFGGGNELNAIRYALIAAPVVPVYYPDGSYVKVTSDLGDPTLYGDGNANPMALIDATDWTIKRYRIFGNVFAELNLFTSSDGDGLRLRTTLGADLLFENEKLFKERLSQAIYDPTSLNESRVFDQNLVWNNTADFQKTFGKFRTSGLVGMEAIVNKTNFLSASANNFSRTDPLFRYINNSVPTDIKNLGASGIETEWALLSYFAQGGISYDSRYVVNASVRRDGSSRFGDGNRWGVFPSVSAAWNVSNEPFFAKVPVVSTLKFRASWGKLGNQEIGVYPYSSLVETGRRVYNFGDQSVTGARLVEAGNSNIRWETTTQTDYGVELGLWKDRLSFVADYYKKLTSDVLVRVPIPQAGGSQNPPYVNAGEVENKGWEFSATLRGGKKGLSYTIGANIATVRNEVVSLADSEPIPGGFGLSDGAITKTEVGYPIGSFFLWKMEGIFQTQEEVDASPFQNKDTRPGDVKFADLNADGIIDDKDRAHLGNPFPDIMFGLNASISYKNFDLSALAQGIRGNDVYFLFGNFAYEVQARGFNSYNGILDRWTPTNTDTDIPKVSLDDRNGNRRISTRWLEDGSYLRIRNITLGYDFKDLIKTASIGNLRAYFTVQNAFTFTKYPGLDPEIQANTNDTRGIGISSDLAVGIDWGTVPAPRTWIGGVQIDF
ncbi:MAG: TonB-dependent receptor [Saprospiraceae bacterium]|nr:TonB-dependent receptor [Saprospiraceae bacterium]MCF8250979.1 TonB-dependent receptor [Saprospiraceae bacterium]MCF8280308.1 TonB-dependent receptor [Bacteroidales bacterium]MCF8312835.1 TonB-dependent receptor [Saprospiraceae bacterium]MCF8441282.1 TonB-dependent receptor [Saprospiraceae bacterium]